MFNSKSPDRRRVIKSIIGAAAIPVFGRSRAAAWPAKPITFVVPFGAGAGNDITSRTLAHFLEAELGTSIVVINKPGAGGEIGLNMLFDANPDGYTISNISSPGVVTIPIERKPRWSLSSFEYIASVVNDPAVIAVHPDSDIHTIQDLVAAAKADPKAVTVATQGEGSASAFSLRLLEKAANVQFSGVPYTAGPQIIMALAQKQVVAATANLGEGMMMTSGMPWRPLGVMSRSRLSIAPKLPTFAEAGYPIEMGSLRGLATGKGVPPDIIARFSAAVANVVRNPEYIKACQQSFQPIEYQPRDQYLKTLADMDANFRAIWNASPWK